MSQIAGCQWLSCWVVSSHRWRGTLLEASKSMDFVTELADWSHLPSVQWQGSDCEFNIEPMFFKRFAFGFSSSPCSSVLLWEMPLRKLVGSMICFHRTQITFSVSGWKFHAVSCKVNRKMKHWRQMCFDCFWRFFCTFIFNTTPPHCWCPPDFGERLGHRTPKRGQFPWNGLWIAALEAKTSEDVDRPAESTKNQAGWHYGFHV